jgi:hypothetical protein
MDFLRNAMVIFKVVNDVSLTVLPQEIKLYLL